MSHVKAEPRTDQEAPPNDLRSQPLELIDKHEESDLDMEDVITEPSTSPQDISPSTSPPPYGNQPQQADEDADKLVRSTNKKQKDKEQVQSLKIKRTSDSSSYRVVANGKEGHGAQTRPPKTPMNVNQDRPDTPIERNARSNGKRQHSKEVDSLLNDNDAKQAAPITKRRTTTAKQCLVSDASNGSAGRKRRLSTKNAEDTEDARTTQRTRNSIDSTGTAATTSKRMRFEQNTAKSDGVADAAHSLSTTPKLNDTNKSTRANSKLLSSNIVAASAVNTAAIPMVSIAPSTPRTNKSKNRQDKPKTPATTPRITQYFSQQKTSTPVLASNSNTTTAQAVKAAAAPSSLTCEKCSTILSSVNELNFHLKSHELNCCVKCKKPIDDAANPIGTHVVSCFLLDNKISNDLLTRFLKVKVDLDRLTPVKIQQIQKNLQANESQNMNGDTIAKSSAIVSSMRQENAEKPRRESSPTDENAQNSINDKSFDGKNSADRNGTKKAKNKKCNPNKSATTKNVQDFGDDVLITENTAAALNWNDEPNKDKMFSLRNFECDANIYINIKDVLNNGSAETQNKVTNLVKRISLLKQIGAPSPAQGPPPAVAEATATAASAVKPTPPNPKGVTLTQQQSLSVRQSPTVQAPAQIPTLQAALTRNNSKPTAVPTSSASTPIAFIRNAGNASPYALVASPALHASNMPNPQSPQVACAPQAIPLATMQTTAFTPNESNASNTPMLLDLPQRFRLRNRAYSIHFAPIEQAPSQIIARRQSYGYGLVSADATAATSISTAQPPDHTYTMANGQRPTPAPLPPLPYMTHIHAREIAVQNCPTANTAPVSNQPKQLKILTPDDLNSRAANALQPMQSVANSRTDSPNSTENNSNLNNNQPPAVKRVRTKTTPMRNNTNLISDDANITISVSLTKLGADQAELSLTTEQHGKITYDALTDKRKQEVQSSLLKDDVWLKMLKHLKTIRPTNETMQLFKQILPVQQHNTFMTELRKVYGNRI